ncbi:hypothetical protein [Campylobacter canadensis]|uniref:hypothetical protein n=1 Tax=Campylobacter canadensis TaxID=449520 RepID=UPI001CCFE1CB|nr:hypothetical protein [Campylobacter canadensis]MBZ8002758.1 hypothetical protein [Campylobacter canadensis]
MIHILRQNYNFSTILEKNITAKMIKNVIVNNDEKTAKDIFLRRSYFVIKKTDDTSFMHRKTKKVNQLGDIKPITYEDIEKSIKKIFNAENKQDVMKNAHNDYIFYETQKNFSYFLILEKNMLNLNIYQKLNYLKKNFYLNFDKEIKNIENELNRNQIKYRIAYDFWSYSVKHDIFYNNPCEIIIIKDLLLPPFDKAKKIDEVLNKEKNYLVFDLIIGESTFSNTNIKYKQESIFHTDLQSVIANITKKQNEIKCLKI